MNVDEYGVVFMLNTDFNMASYTALSLTFTKPDGSTLAKTTGVTVGSVDVVTDDGSTFSANEYARYTFVNGDVDQSGEWSARLTYTDAGQRLVSEVAEFTVED